MTGDRPLWTLVVGTVATYPGLWIVWCVSGLLGLHGSSRSVASDHLPEVGAYLVLAVVSVISIVLAVRTAARALSATGGLVQELESRRVRAPGRLAAAAAGLDIARLMVVDDTEEFAFTVGVLRPRVVVSSRMAAALSDAELRAVLAHEASHTRRLDPLRALAAKVAAAHLWFAPVAKGLRSRAESEHELAADRYAVDRCGRAALASALLRAAPGPGTAEVAVSGFAATSLLEARVRQLESGGVRLPGFASVPRSALSGIAVLGFVSAVAASWSLMIAACPCPM
ncbi:hypothetical protein GCM10027447_33220 [Glycomyces halotolerans]